MPSHSHPVLILPPPMQQLTTSLTLTVFLFTTITMVSFPSNYASCIPTFSCGNLVDIYYPFTGSENPAYCGLPDFQLTCVNDSITYLTVNSLSYRVLELNQTNQTLILSRSDLYNTTCTPQPVNTTFDNTSFSLGSGNEVLTLFYGCNDSVIPYEPDNFFTCEINGKKDAYYLFGSVPSDLILNIFGCGAVVTVPILDRFVHVLEGNRSLFGEVLRDGFNVSYTNAYAGDCEECYYHSGGICGFNASSHKFLCTCGDRLCPEGQGNKSNSWIKLGIGIGAATFAAIFSVGLARYHFATRRGSKNPKHEKNIQEFIENYHSLMPKQYVHSDIKKMTNSFANKLGQGGFGSVYRGKLQDGRDVAVKVLSKSVGDGEEFINEVVSISRTSHVNIVTLLGFCYEGTNRALIYEYMPNGSLDKFIYDPGHHLEQKMLYDIAIGVARGLEYLHRGCSTRIVHFDIKPQNVLLDEDFCPKISDFGLAKLCKGKESIVSMLNARGTVGYIAPEVFMRSIGRASHKSDVYSYGMMMLEMFGRINNTETRASESREVYFPDQIYEYLESGQESIMNENRVDRGEEDMKRRMMIIGLWCIQTNPSERPSITKVVEMLEGSVESLQIPKKPSLLTAANASTSVYSTTLSSAEDMLLTDG